MQLPKSRTEINQATTDNLKQVLADCICTTPLSPDTQALKNVITARERLPIEIVPLADGYANKVLPDERYEEHDDYFGIVRVAGNPLRVEIHSILQAYGELLQEGITLGTRLSPLEWGRLRIAFDSMLRFLIKEPSAESTVDSAYALPSPAADCKFEPVRRWRIGHHVFLVLIQSLVVSFNCFGNMIRAGNLSEAKTLLKLATRLMFGSASALRFAGDFRGEQYENQVRPSMMPPNLEPGFSGLQSMDHQYLTKSLANLKPIFTNLDPCLQAQHAQFTRAFEVTYDAHKFVCARFRGEEIPSLRMNPGSKRSAVAVLDQLKSVRLRAVNPSEVAKPTSRG